MDKNYEINKKQKIRRKKDGQEMAHREERNMLGGTY